jgi:hypothetical protein
MVQKLAIKLIEVLENSVSSHTLPWRIRRQKRAEALGHADAVLIGRLAQEKARQAVADVRAGRATIDENMKLIPSNPPTAETAAEALKVQLLDALAAQQLPPHRLVEIERQINLEQVAAFAIDEASEDETEMADDEPIDPDWFAQWRNRAQDVSNEDMQRLWAKVLTGQTRTSGEFSIHAMDLLSRMSREDAELFAKLGECTADYAVVFAPSSTNPYLEELGLSFGHLLYLQEIGVLSGISAGRDRMNREIKVVIQPDGLRAAVIRIGQHLLTVIPKDEKLEKLSIPGYKVTRVGAQLLKLAQLEGSEAVSTAIAKHLEPKALKITRAKIISETNELYQTGPGSILYTHSEHTGP